MGNSFFVGWHTNIQDIWTCHQWDWSWGSRRSGSGAPSEVLSKDLNLNTLMLHCYSNRDFNKQRISGITVQNINCALPGLHNYGKFYHNYFDWCWDKNWLILVTKMFLLDFDINITLLSCSCWCKNLCINIIFIFVRLNCSPRRRKIEIKKLDQNLTHN